MERKRSGSYARARFSSGLTAAALPLPAAAGLLAPPRLAAAAVLLTTLFSCSCCCRLRGCFRGCLAGCRAAAGDRAGGWEGSCCAPSSSSHSSSSVSALRLRPCGTVAGPPRCCCFCAGCPAGASSPASVSWLLPAVSDPTSEGPSRSLPTAAVLVPRRGCCLLGVPAGCKRGTAARLPLPPLPAFFVGGASCCSSSAVRPPALSAPLAPPSSSSAAAARPRLPPAGLRCRPLLPGWASRAPAASPGAGVPPTDSPARGRSQGSNAWSARAVEPSQMDKASQSTGQETSECLPSHLRPQSSLCARSLPPLPPCAPCRALTAALLSCHGGARRPWQALAARASAAACDRDSKSVACKEMCVSKRRCSERRRRQ